MPAKMRPYPQPNTHRQKLEFKGWISLYFSIAFGHKTIITTKTGGT